MTIDRETLIWLARESGADVCAGYRDNDELDEYYEFWPEQLERFAALVLEHGRKPLTYEQLFDVMEAFGFTYDRTEFARAVEAAHGITNKESSDVGSSENCKDRPDTQYKGKANAG